VVTVAPSAIVVVGSGHGGVQVAASLRDEGYDGRLVLIGDEPELPYHRPPLSKSYVTSQEPALDPLRSEAFFDKHSIELLVGNPVSAIDTSGRRAEFADGTYVDFGHLVLAVGSRHRRLPVPGGDLDGVHGLRTAAEAGEIRTRLREARSAVVIGGGFIGMEFAAAVAAAGVEVVLLEAAERTMARVVTPAVSTHLETNQKAYGVRVEVGAVVTEIEGADGRVTGVVTSEGVRHPADLVLIGVGAQANTTLATAAGLAVGDGPRDGILVNSALLTDHPDISAIGDCARYPVIGGTQRLESVQNAVDQGRYVATRLVGRASEAYHRVPWFWSDQGATKLQIAGLCEHADRSIVRGNPDGGKFSLIGLAGQRVAAVESINKPADHMAARKLIAEGATLSDEEAADTSFPLKSALGRATTGGTT
jgi:3-phenylpropionate/trans-cinnamate dioxygenase ferredoxin reductase component